MPRRAARCPVDAVPVWAGLRARGHAAYRPFHISANDRGMASAEGLWGAGAGIVVESAAEPDRRREWHGEMSHLRVHAALTGRRSSGSLGCSPRCVYQRQRCRAGGQRRAGLSVVKITSLVASSTAESGVPGEPHLNHHRRR
eukprot:4370443-Prymnesium_polylepis.2